MAFDNSIFNNCIINNFTVSESIVRFPESKLEVEVEIPLTGKHGEGKTTRVNLKDYEYLRPFNWYVDNKCYPVRYEGGQRIYMHREIMDRIDGGSDFTVDHRDGNQLNNTRSNLRRATSSQQNSNRGVQSNNKLGITGIYWDKTNRCYYAHISKEGKRISKSFKVLDEAIQWRQQKEIELFGEFRRE